MAFKFLRNMVTTAFVGIVMDSDRCDVYIKVFKGSKIIKFESHTLRMEDGELSRVGIGFLNSIYKKYYFVYSGALLLTINQGSFSGLGKKGLELHEIRQVGTKVIEVDKLWSFYASEADLNLMKSNYEHIGGLDYIFSTYSIINNNREKGCVLYILKLHGFASIAIFDNDELVYGNFFMFVPKEVSFGEGLITQGDHQNDSDGAEDGHAEDDDDDPFAAMGGMEDATEISEADTGTIASLEKDTKLIEFTKACLSSYYKEPVYEANFVDRVLVLDPYNESEEFKALGEEELLLPIDVKHIGLSEAVCMLAIQESYKK